MIRGFLQLALRCVLALAALLVNTPARAWVTTTVESSVVTLDVAVSGHATVAHEFVLRVRGGPLKSFSLKGVDGDAAILPDSTVTPITKEAAKGSQPLPLLVQLREDGSLVLEVDQARGLRAGSYLFRFSYGTELLARKLLRLQNGIAELAWVGPRFDDGIGSARVIFRLPPGASQPELVEVDAEQAALGLAEDPGGVFVASLRRGHDKDELEVVRPHVAKGEPAVWRVRAAAGAFRKEPSAPTEAPLAPQPSDEVLAPPVGPWALLAGGLAALFYTALLLLKWRAARLACARRAATPRALVPLNPALRAGLAGSCLGLSVIGAMREGSPTVAGGLLIAAMLLATHGSPKFRQVLRGPGRWLALTDDEVRGGPASAMPGRWLDAGTLPGFLIFAACLAAITGGALRLLGDSPYEAALLALAASCLLPLFFSGRLAELPPDPVVAPRELLGQIAAALKARPNLKVVFWARIPDNSSAPDELRLLIRPHDALDGLSGIEVGLEYQQGLTHFVAAPFVIVRVREDSGSYFALPRSVIWTRGRKPEERVAIIRPRLPTRALCVALVERLLTFLETSNAAPHAVAARPQSSAIRIPIASGKGSVTAKPASSRLPLHAT